MCGGSGREGMKAWSLLTCCPSTHPAPLHPPPPPPPPPPLFPRYIRREKEIADTKRELAESENVRHRQLADHLKSQLAEARDQLSEVTEAARSHTETAAQHAEILAKV